MIEHSEYESKINEYKENVDEEGYIKIGKENFVGIKIIDEEFDLINVKGSNFYQAEFEQVIFRSDIFKGDDIKKVNINRSSSFKFCVFMRSKLIDCYFKGMDFSCSDFKGAKITNCDFFVGSFISCNFTNAIIKGCDFIGADFRNANFKGAQFVNCGMDGAYFQDVKFENTELSLWGQRVKINSIKEKKMS